MIRRYALLDKEGKVVIGIISFFADPGVRPAHNPHVEIFDNDIKIGMTYDDACQSFDDGKFKVGRIYK